MNLGGHKVEFIHFPPHGDSGDIERYQDFRPKDDGETIYVHGHVHEAGGVLERNGTTFMNVAHLDELHRPTRPAMVFEIG